MTPRLASAWLFLVLPACAGSLHDVEKRQAAIEDQIARDARRAAELRADTLQLEHRLRLQRECIAEAECTSKIALFDAAFAKEVADCNRQVSDWVACDAQRTASTVSGASLGCLVGTLLAPESGGLTLAACGAGAVAGNSSATGPCVGVQKPRDCGSRGDEFRGIALAAAKLTEIPACPAHNPACDELFSRSR